MEFSAQVSTFLLIAATGILLGVLFDTYRVLRGVFRPPWLITSVADLLYWLVAAGIAFLALILGNWGELRFYVFIAMISGVAVYYRLASRYVVKLIMALLKLLASSWRSAKRVVVFTIVKPVRFVVRTSLLPFRYMGRRYSAWCKKRFPPPPPPEEIPPQ
ncbi:spore cortex biosynthesis protein YabQ [Sporomusa malonica]|uniref:Spore cortex biosynthesis protein YabQ n=1 Tax=Sporomusa malonica TaxID=112901 RepID=A0A1W2E594_9FIRM|nr:spore cortex biosynthesis protein YabQ [Sporomusa malonica]SMD04592.1 spore cortex biosynthesis protein YabQ [Sporomusa malonica]